ncbi:uncharacterized protein LOC130668671 [Microplitis mediator]|uniref:uncharacterized protein LOC130668671 n=1 Tax=Microplitis mediator TaxID=375433 RepID=UPI0025523B67|nr:uncharacterized protein LOC130668671 [Microplitis mediator]
MNANAIGNRQIVSSLQLANEERIKWFNPKNIGWMVPVLKVDSFNRWHFQCNGILIHPKAVVTTDECVPYQKHGNPYAVSTYIWANDNRSAYISPNYMNKPTAYLERSNFTVASFRYGNNKVTYVNTRLPVVMIFWHPINSFEPLNISTSLEFYDIFRNRREKQCINVVLNGNSKNDDSDLSSENFDLQLLPKEIMKRTEFADRINMSLSGYYRQYSNAKYTYLHKTFPIFVTHLDEDFDRKAKKYSIGSPILCQFVNENGNFKVAGMFTDMSLGSNQYVNLKDFDMIGTLLDFLD